MISTDLRERQWRYAMKRKERKEAKKGQTKAQDRLSKRDKNQNPPSTSDNTNPAPPQERGEKPKNSDQRAVPEKEDSDSESNASVFLEKEVDYDKDMVTDQTEERHYQKEVRKGPRIIRNLRDVEREKRRLRKEGMSEKDIKEYLGSQEQQYEDEAKKDLDYSDLSSDEECIGGDNAGGQKDKNNDIDKTNQNTTNLNPENDQEMTEMRKGEEAATTTAATPTPPPQVTNKIAPKIIPTTVQDSPLAPPTVKNTDKMAPVNPTTLTPNKNGGQNQANIQKPQEKDNTTFTDYYIVYDLLCENLPQNKKASNSKTGHFSLYERMDNYNDKTDLTKCSMCEQIIPFYKVGNTIEIVVMTDILSNMKEEAKINPANCRHFETIEIDMKMKDIKTYLEPILNTLKMMLSVHILLVVGDNDIIDDYTNIEVLKNDLLDMVGTLMTPCSELDKENRGRPFLLKMVELPFFPIISKIGQDKHTPLADKTDDISQFNAYLNAINTEGVPNFLEIIPSLKKEGITIETFDEKPSLNSHIMGDWKGKDTADKKRYIKAHVKKRFWEKVHTYFRQVSMLSQTNR